MSRKIESVSHAWYAGFALGVLTHAGTPATATMDRGHVTDRISIEINTVDGEHIIMLTVVDPFGGDS